MALSEKVAPGQFTDSGAESGGDEHHQQHLHLKRAVLAL
jgi:hypothetical protein